MPSKQTHFQKEEKPFSSKATKSSSKVRNNAGGVPAHGTTVARSPKSRNASAPPLALPAECRHRASGQSLDRM